VFKLLLTISSALQISNPYLLPAICWVESNHDPDAININDGGSPSFGMCQIKLNTARWMAEKHGLSTPYATHIMKPEVNALLAGLYIKYQLKRYKGNIHQAISAYNAGKYIKSNIRYVNKVIKRMEYYEQK
jgi:soluble lytic murein transglycosylase-like protein